MVLQNLVQISSLICKNLHFENGRINYSNFLSLSCSIKHYFEILKQSFPLSANNLVINEIV